MASALVVGGTGTVGSHIATRLAAEGYEVLVPTRSAHEHSSGAAIRFLDADISSIEGLETLSTYFEANSIELTVGVIALGGWWQQGPVRSIDPHEWSWLLDGHLTAHFHALKLLLNHQAESGATIVGLNGIATVEPISDAAPICTAGAAQTMLMQVCATEEPTTRFHELRVMADIVKDNPTSEQVGVERVAESVHALVSVESDTFVHVLNPLSAT